MQFLNIKLYRLIGHLINVLTKYLLVVLFYVVSFSGEATDNIKQLRHKLRHKERPLIITNDGMDIVCFAKNMDDLIKRHKKYFETDISTMNFCVSFAGFGKMLYRTSAGEIQDDKKAFKNNLTPEMLNDNTDPLAFMIDFYHKHHLELFCSLRLNDNHDHKYPPDSQMFRTIGSKFKASHPELLFGKFGDIVPHAVWSGVDYASPIIRDKFLSFVKEICNNYDIDGLELNFWRHLPLFKSVAWGRDVSKTETEAMTAMIEGIRKIADEAGKKRGRPILIAVNIPDTVEYCKAQGLDVEAWLKKDLVDILFPGGYFRLDSWKTMVELGKKYDVPVFACLNDARVSVVPGKPYGQLDKIRDSVEAYRARSMIAWDCGVDGINVFNRAHPLYPYYKEIASVDKIRFLDKVYFCSFDGGCWPSSDAGRYLKDGTRFQKIPVLSPNRPLLLMPDKSEKIKLLEAEDIKASMKSGIKAKVECFIRVAQKPLPSSLKINFNGKAMVNPEYLPDGSPVGPFYIHGIGKGETVHKLTGNWLRYRIEPGSLKKSNVLEFLYCNNKSISGNEKDLPWKQIYCAGNGTVPQSPWFHAVSGKLTSEIKASQLFLENKAGKITIFSQAFYYLSEAIFPGTVAIMEAELKTLSGKALIMMSNGENAEYFYLTPCKAGLQFARKSVAVEPGGFHKCRMMFSGNKVSAWIDGKQLLADRTMTVKSKRKTASFGPGNQNRGLSVWREVKFLDDSLFIYDIMLTVKYSKQEKK